MGSFWIFFLFMGIVALVKRKEMASQEDTTPQNTPTGAPTKDEKQEIERRIREILGEPQPEKRVAPAQSATPRPAVRPARPKVKVQSTHTSLEQITPEISMSSHRLTQSATSRSTAIPKKAQTAPTEVTDKSELDAMIDDFSIEKAVIYSEILEPKFKEY
ncbi:MAG: hypothetical protein IJ434_08930 [Alistipes sp.]|nr:hypothetical protein [Alistipes sp.]